RTTRNAGSATISLDEAADAIRIAVADTGVGMAPEQLDRLFSPFERLGAEHGTIEGSGLGLVVTRGLVEAMDGRLDVTSEVGTGTTFAVELPLRTAESLERAHAGPGPPSAAAGKVLYIEDNPANLQIVETIL